MGLLNLWRVGGLLGGPAPSGGGGGPPGTWTELGRGSALVLQGTNTILDSAVVTDGDTIFPGFPTQRDQLNLSMFSENTASGAGGGTGMFTVEKDAAVAKQHNYRARTFATAGSRTFDWSWYSVRA